MKKKNALLRLTALLLAALCLLAGCSDKDSSAAQAAMKLEYDNTAVDEAYATLMQTYFTAIEQRDYAAYKALVYPPYLAANEAFLQENHQYGTEKSFENRCDAFNRDGFDRYTFTTLQMSKATTGTMDDYYQDMADVFGEDFQKNMEADMESSEILLFSLYAKYGEEEPGAVVEDAEMIVVTAKDGTRYLFG